VWLTAGESEMTVILAVYTYIMSSIKCELARLKTAQAVQTRLTVKNIQGLLNFHNKGIRNRVKIKRQQLNYTQHLVLFTMIGQLFSVFNCDSIDPSK